MPSPTLAEINARVRTDIELAIPGADAHTELGGYRQIANVYSAQMYSAHRKIDWALDQYFTATADEQHLLRQASLLLEVPRIDASFAAGNVDVPGVNGSVIAVGEILQSSEGTQFTVTAEATVAAGTASVAIIATEAGDSGNLLTGAALVFQSPVAGISGNAIVDGNGITGGSEIETIDRVRERLAERKSAPPEGGALHDYIAWAKAAHVDVHRVFVNPHENGDGSIAVRFITNVENGVIPSAGLITIVTDYMDTVKPYNLKALAVEAPTAVPLDITFTVLDPNTAEVQAAIEAEIADLLSRESTPGQVLYLSHIREAISRASNENNFAINLTADITYQINEIGILGAITWP